MSIHFPRCSKTPSLLNPKASSADDMLMYLLRFPVYNLLDKLKHLGKNQCQWFIFFRLLNLHYLPDTSSIFIISFISSVDKTISSKTGTEPPTNPVLPPCGQTANFFSLQKRNICEVCSVVLGFKIQLLYPARIQLNQYTYN